MQSDRPWGTVGKGIGVRRGLWSKVRHELSTRFVIPAWQTRVRAPQQRGDKHAASAEAVGERERPTSPACNIAGMWPDPADNEKNIRWVRDYYAALAPHSLAGGYVNFASADDQAGASATTNEAPPTTGSPKCIRPTIPATCSAATRTSCPAS